MTLSITGQLILHNQTFFFVGFLFHLQKKLLRKSKKKSPLLVSGDVGARGCGDLRGRGARSCPLSKEQASGGQIIPTCGDPEAVGSVARNRTFPLQKVSLFKCRLFCNIMQTQKTGLRYLVIGGHGFVGMYSLKFFFCFETIYFKMA